MVKVCWPACTRIPWRPRPSAASQCTSQRAGLARRSVPPLPSLALRVSRWWQSRATAWTTTVSGCGHAVLFYFAANAAKAGRGRIWVGYWQAWDARHTRREGSMVIVRKPSPHPHSVLRLVLTRAEVHSADASSASSASSSVRSSCEGTDRPGTQGSSSSPRTAWRSSPPLRV